MAENTIAEQFKECLDNAVFQLQDTPDRRCLREIASVLNDFARTTTPFTWDIVNYAKQCVLQEIPGWAMNFGNTELRANVVRAVRRRRE